MNQQSNKENTTETRQATVSNVGYLGSSKIYLVSANSSYGQYDRPEINSPGFVEVHAGDPCFRITVTLRNDYTIESPVPDSKYSNNTEYANFMISAYLYDKNGNIITAPDVTDQHWMPIKIPQHGLSYGKTSTFNMILLTSSHDIDRYEIRLWGPSSMPIP
jgi:hypothetical protein